MLTGIRGCTRLPQMHFGRIHHYAQLGRRTPGGKRSPPDFKPLVKIPIEAHPRSSNQRIHGPASLVNTGGIAYEAQIPPLPSRFCASICISDRRRNDRKERL
jgi:hypothetical protein